MRQTQIKTTKRETLSWKEADKAEYGDTIEKVQAEFQALGLISKGSNPIVQDSVKVGEKTKYLCIPDCPFAIRLVTYDNDPTKFELESASKLPLNPNLNSVFR